MSILSDISTDSKPALALDEPGEAVEDFGDVPTAPMTAAATDNRLRTELGNGERLAAALAGDWIHNADTGVDYHFNGNLYRPDVTGKVHRKAKALARKIWTWAKEAETRTERAAIFKWAQQSERASGIRAAIELGRTEPGIIIESNDLDADSMLAGCPGGIVDLRTGDVRPGKRDDRITKSLAVTPADESACALWESIVERAFAGDSDLIEFFQRLCGLFLTGDVRDQFLYVFYGSGANSKSTLLDSLLAIVKDYGGQAPDSLLTARMFGEHPTEIISQEGKRLSVASETESGARMRVQMMKKLTGDAELIGRGMRENYRTFKRQFKLVLCTNNRPQVDENSEAVWRRILLVPFRVTIPPAERDPHLLQKLKKEWPGILRWMVQGCLSWQVEGLRPPQAVVAATDEYKASANPLAEYVAERLVVSARERITRPDLVQDYAAYCVQIGDKNPAGRVELFEHVRRIGGVTDTQWKPAGSSIPVRGFAGIGKVQNVIE